MLYGVLQCASVGVLSQIVWGRTKRYMTQQVNPSGRLPSDLVRPLGSSMAGWIIIIII